MEEKECTVQLGSYYNMEHLTHPASGRDMRSDEFVLGGTRWWLRPNLSFPDKGLQLYLESAEPSFMQSSCGDHLVTVHVYGHRRALVSEQQFVVGLNMSRVFIDGQHRLSLLVTNVPANQVWPNDTPRGLHYHMKLRVVVRMEELEPRLEACAANALTCSFAGTSSGGGNRGMQKSQTEMFGEVEDTPPFGQATQRIVLVSSDRVAFYTHPVVMCAQSDVLQTWCQDQHGSDQDHHSVETQFERLKLRNNKMGVVDVYRPYKLEQSAYEVRALLAFMYVGDGFEQLTVHELAQVLALADHLHVDGGIKAAVAAYAKNARKERFWTTNDKVDFIKLLVERNCDDALAVIAKRL